MSQPGFRFMIGCTCTEFPWPLQKIIVKLVPKQKIVHTAEFIKTFTETTFKNVEETLVLDGKERVLKFPYPRGDVATIGFLRKDGRAVVSLHRTKIKTDLERSDRTYVSENEICIHIRILRAATEIGELT